MEYDSFAMGPYEGPELSPFATIQPGSLWTPIHRMFIGSPSVVEFLGLATLEATSKKVDCYLFKAVSQDDDLKKSYSFYFCSVGTLRLTLKRKVTLIEEIVL